MGEGAREASAPATGSSQPADLKTLRALLLDELIGTHAPDDRRRDTP
jgi:hypothetical protein